MFYILYQVTNNLNGKIYVGVHKTQDVNDGYMGSGKVIKSAVAKYGIENFTRVILEQFENSTDMYAREKEVVTDEFLARDDTYNLRRGGTGGFDYLHKSGLSVLLPEQRTRQPEKSKEWSRKGMKNAVASMKANSTGLYAPDFVHPFNRPECREKALTAAASEASNNKRKDTFAKMNHAKGAKNSQFGSKWITNEIESKKILKSDPIPEGWRAGRKMT